MKVKSRVLVASLTILSVIILLIAGYFSYSYIRIFFADKTWIKDFGYSQSEVHELSFDWIGDRSCPEIPVKVGNNEYNLLFDTGCGSGIAFTNAIQDKIDYTVLSQSESLNRDGSHRAWDKKVKVNEINVFGNMYKNVQTTISDWSTFSSKKFNGMIGLAYFKSKVITLDYAGHKIAVSSRPIDYTKLDSTKYAALPLYKSTSDGQQDLLFFKAEYNHKPITVYMDTGKNYSYLYNPNSTSSIEDKPTNFIDVPIKIGSMKKALNQVAQANDGAQAAGLPYPTMLELNSDQIWKCNLLVTIDLINQKIIFRKI